MLIPREAHLEKWPGNVATDFQRRVLLPGQDSVSLLEEAERRARRLLGLHQVALAIGGQADSQETLQLILSQACQLLRSPAGTIFLLDERSGELRCSVAQSAPETAPGSPTALDKGAPGVAFRDCKTVLINNYPSWSGASSGGLAAGVEAALSVPLRIGERLLGALTVQTYDAGQTFDEEDAWLLELLGDQAATALEQTRLVEQIERRAARLLALHRVSTAISAQSDIGTTLALVLSQVAQLLERQGSSIYLWEKATERLVLAEAHGLPLDKLPASLAPGEGLPGQVWSTGEAVIVDDYHGAEQAIGPRPGGRSAAAGVPLAVAGRQLGVLAVVAADDGSSFTKDEVQLLELFAGQAAIALDNARLFDAATRARAMEELDRLKSEFISTVSHELRTPLTYIHGYAELLVGRHLKTEQVTEAVAEIHGASLRMARLVDDLLDLSRLEAGRLDLRLRELDLAALLRGAVAAARIQAGDQPIDLQLEELPELTADPERLRQVIDNLLVNARLYAPLGAVTVRARLDGDFVRVEVADQGPGIAARVQGRIFEAFYRGSRSEVSPLRGGGLGLTIVRRLVEAHGGQVGLESAPGRGSTFWFTVPIHPPLEMLESPASS